MSSATLSAQPLTSAPPCHALGADTGSAKHSIFVCAAPEECRKCHSCHALKPTRIRLSSALPPLPHLEPSQTGSQGVRRQPCLLSPSGVPKIPRLPPRRPSRAGSQRVWQPPLRGSSGVPKVPILLRLEPSRSGSQRVRQRCAAPQEYRKCDACQLSGNMRPHACEA